MSREATVEMFEGRKMQRVTITATVEFEAYIFADDPETGEVESKRGMVAHEIAGGIQYHAPHLRDSEDADALIACTAGGSEGAVRCVAYYKVLTDDVDPADVVDAIESTRAGLS